MSYSFAIRGANKAQAKALIAEKFDQTLVTQPVHAQDKEQALAAANAFIDLLPDSEDHDVVVAVSGYLSGTWSYGALLALTTASFNVNASLMARAT